jgi:hypothetical protein
VSRGACGPLCILNMEIGVRTAADIVATRARLLGQVCPRPFSARCEKSARRSTYDRWIGRGSSPCHGDLLTSPHPTSSPLETPVVSGDDLVGTIQFW